MPSHFSARTDAALPEGERDPLNRALRDLSHQVGSAMPRNTTPMPISVFKAQYGAVLKQADHDGVALISQGRKRYVIVSEEHMVALSANERAPARWPTSAGPCRCRARPWICPLRRCPGRAAISTYPPGARHEPLPAGPPLPAVDGEPGARDPAVVLHHPAAGLHRQRPVHGHRQGGRGRGIPRPA
ncbi:hypothetical protein ACHFCA_33695 [Delftia tsuruhatensis]